MNKYLLVFQTIMKNRGKKSFISLLHKIWSLSIILYLFVVCLPVFSEQRNFKKIDEAVIGMRRARRIRKVIRFIASHSMNNWDRARGAYVWVAKNIKYDADAYFSGKIEHKDAKKAFRSRKSVCQGYAELYSEIVSGLGLEVVVINGYAKGYGYIAGTRFEKTDHAWNAVKIDNKWRLMETTWGAGHVDSGKFIPDYTTAWFDTDPRLFVLHHFPKNTRWLLNNSPLTLSEYEEMPHIESYHLDAFFEAGFNTEEQLMLIKNIPFPKYFDAYSKAFSLMGGKTSDLIKFLEQGSVPSFWTYPRICPRLIDYPKTGILSAGKKYRFSFRIPNSKKRKKAAIISGGIYTYMKKKGDVYSGEAVVISGEVRLSVKITHDGQNSYWPLAIWQCK